MLFFVDSASWIEFLKTVRFCFGTRIHGNIAALVAGTPAVVLVHDLRTQELVDYHQIPYRLADDAAGFDAADLYEEADFTNFNVGHAARFATFQNFLHENGIATVFDPGQANPGYDERLAALPLPGPVRPDFKQRRGRTIERLTRRWQRTIYRFAAPVPHAPSTLVETAEATIARMLGPVRSR